MKLPSLLIILTLALSTASVASNTNEPYQKMLRTLPLADFKTDITSSRLLIAIQQYELQFADLIATETDKSKQERYGLIKAALIKATENAAEILLQGLSPVFSGKIGIEQVLNHNAPLNGSMADANQLIDRDSRKMALELANILNVEVLKSGETFERTLLRVVMKKLYAMLKENKKEYEAQPAEHPFVTFLNTLSARFAAQEHTDQPRATNGTNPHGLRFFLTEDEERQFQDQIDQRSLAIAMLKMKLCQTLQALEKTKLDIAKLKQVDEYMLSRAEAFNVAAGLPKNHIIRTQFELTHAQQALIPLFRNEEAIGFGADVCKILNVTCKAQSIAEHLNVTKIMIEELNKVLDKLAK